MDRRAVLFLFDLLILIGSFILMLLFKPEPKNYLTEKYILGFVILLLPWIIASVKFEKYVIERKIGLIKIFTSIVSANFIALAVISIFVVALHVDEYSRLIFFGTVLIATLAELFFANIDYLLIHTVENTTDIYNPPVNAIDIVKAGKAINYKGAYFDEAGIREGIIDQCGEHVYNYISKHVDLSDPKALIISTSTRFNIQLLPDHYYKKIINLRRVNDIQYINKFFEAVNRKIPAKGIFVGCVETNELRKKRILRKYLPGIRWIMYILDFTIKSIFPKFMLTKKIYYLLTRGENRVLSRAEVLGRLYSCGFEVLEEQVIRSYLYFVVRKVKDPAYDMNPTYGPFIKLKRIGKGGKIIKVYKLRTMHPYAEYLQEYMFNKHHLDQGGKFRNDFRVSQAGKIMRTFWLDELPMLFNFLKGEMKLFGIRPLSEQYFNLYSEELRVKRTKCKPGLIPPFYVDMPKTLSEIQTSELKYLDAHAKHPLRTDFVYLFRAIYNIIFRNARSR